MPYEIADPAKAGGGMVIDRASKGAAGMTVELATLNAYRTVQSASFPALHPDIDQRAGFWSEMTQRELENELATLVSITDRSALMPKGAASGVRVFWKIGAELLYGGCNRAFASDAGFARPSDIIGLDDWDPRFSWILQSAKYRRDDKEVMRTGAPKLGIVERQHSPSGTTWLHTSKAPILVEGRAVGVVGMYEVVDAAAAAKLSRGR